jgi:hypothetical protein
VIKESIKYVFSGHDSFQCRKLWLKKGYDFLQQGKNFNDEDAVVQLGVGKNMVSSIRFWLKAFIIIDRDTFGKRVGLPVPILCLSGQKYFHCNPLRK